MPRKKLSEFRAKTLLYDALGQEYQGWQVDAGQDSWHDQLKGLPDNQHYVVKVDQAEKGRFKKGLVKLDLPKTEVADAVEDLFKQGYQYALVEPYQSHQPEDERYLSVERLRAGRRLSYSKTGGIDVEEQADKMITATYDGQNPADIDIPAKALAALADTFDANYFSFLEINPLLVQGDQLSLLDAAVEVDSEAQFFEEGWQPDDLRSAKGLLTPEELAVRELAEGSQASFSLEVINPNGSIWLLLSGGGASVVVADEVNNLGYGDRLANYGEYSGNPNFEETRIYTEQIVRLLLKSNAPDKVLIIGGGVANFTDIRATFKGVVAALQPHEAELKQQGVKVFVRRGGPYQKEGLAAMKQYLEKAGIAGVIAGPELVLTDIVGLALKGKGSD